MRKDPLLIGIALMAILAIGGFLIFQISTKRPPDNSDMVGNPPIPRRISPPKELLGGHNSPFFIFQRSTYDSALRSNRIIILEFYTKSDPASVKESSELQAGFDELQTASLVGFRINYNDFNANPEEKTLASQFKVTNKNTKIILKNGEVVLQDSNLWNKKIFLEKVNQIL